MNNEDKPIDREIKIMLLQVLKKGYFSEDDINLLERKMIINQLKIIKTYESE
jgi:hypothetical protein